MLLPAPSAASALAYRLKWLFNASVVGDIYADARGFFEAKAVVAMNLMSSPGSGKTTLLEKTITALKGKRPVAVIEGDQQTLNDAERIKQAGAPVVQVNTGNGCHLDADMIKRALDKLDLQENSVLFIENVGNLVCPAEFDIGEDTRVVVLSVTEGEDKPVKYPLMFRECEVALLNKVDLLPYLDYDKQKAIDFIHQIHPGMPVFEISAKTEEGFEPWLEWLRHQVAHKRQQLK